VITAQWLGVDLPAQLQTARLEAEGADRCNFGIEQQSSPLDTPRIRLLLLTVQGGPALGAALQIPDDVWPTTERAPMN
jgi:hypothetical protein